MIWAAQKLLKPRIHFVGKLQKFLFSVFRRHRSATRIQLLNKIWSQRGWACGANEAGWASNQAEVGVTLLRTVYKSLSRMLTHDGCGLKPYVWKVPFSASSIDQLFIKNIRMSLDCIMTLLPHMIGGLWLLQIWKLMDPSIVCTLLYLHSIVCAL